MKSTLLTLLLCFTFFLLVSGCHNSTQPALSGGSLQFTTTNGTYSETANLDSAVKAELGASYRIADWNDVKSYCAVHPVDSLIAIINWSLTDTTGATSADTTRQYFYLLWNGLGFWSQDLTRHFITGRLDHDVPTWWLVHDEIDNNHIVLGSWYGYRFRVLAVKS